MTSSSSVDFPNVGSGIDSGMVVVTDAESARVIGESMISCTNSTSTDNTTNPTSTKSITGIVVTEDTVMQQRVPTVFARVSPTTMTISSESVCEAVETDAVLTSSSRISASPGAPPTGAVRLRNNNLIELAFWVPLRLSSEERSLLTVLEQTLRVSEYTDNVDVTTASSAYGGGGSSYYRAYNSQFHTTSSAISKTRRILDGILEVCHIATGLAIASGQERKFAELCSGAHQQQPVPSSKSTTAVTTTTMTASPTSKVKASNTSNTTGNGVMSVVSSTLSKATGGLSRQQKKQLRENKKKERMRLKEEKRTMKRNKKQQRDTAEQNIDGGNDDADRELMKQRHQAESLRGNGTQALSQQNPVPSSAKPNSPSFHSGPGRSEASNHSSWGSRQPQENATLFQTMFEVGRRNKVLNPSSMRDTYGKMMYLLQDSQNPTVAKALGFTLHKELQLIGPYLEQYDCVQLLHDPRLECAVQYVADRDPFTGEKVDRITLDALLHGKQRVVNDLVQYYASTSLLSTDNVRRVIESLADALVYIESNVRPVEAMLQYLRQNFHPDHEGCHPTALSKPVASGSNKSSSHVNTTNTTTTTTNNNNNNNSNANIRKYHNGSSVNSSNSSRARFASLSLRNGGNRLSTGLNGSGSNTPLYARYGLSAYGGGGGRSYEGPTLSHSHSEQYTFVEQSLRLWCNVMRRMHCLWVCADDDLLSTTCTYHLYNTGQGLNRVQMCPRVRKIMSSLLHQTQVESGKSWVGLSVVHLGDRDVPNALIFIDKYTQIPRFLNPIVTFLQSLLPETVLQDERMAHYVFDQFGSVETLKMMVLQDYFKHGFDGSGDDGGSCIDGRLTSSWNWTSRLSKKPYYYAFLMLSGFQGFDGDFR